MGIPNRSASECAGLLAGLVSLALLAPAPVSATDVAAGFDLWVTSPGEAEHDFVTSPIPADFFYPGSDPFFAFVPLQGTGSGCAGADTVVERLNDAPLAAIPSNANIPIEIVELSLTSVAPVDVTGSNPPEQWDVDVTLSPSPQPQGFMTILHTNPNGGTYDSDLPVCPVFTFIRVSGPPASVQFDLCQAGFPPVQVVTAGTKWTHNVQQPLLCGPQNPQPSSPTFLPLGPHSGPYNPQPLESPKVFLPALGQWGIGLLLLLVTAVGLFMMHRRARARIAS